MQAATIWPSSLAYGGNVFRSSIRPSAKIKTAPSSSAANRSSMCAETASAIITTTGMLPTKIATPPSSGVGVRCQRSRFG